MLKIDHRKQRAFHFLKRVFSFLPFFIMLSVIFCFSGQNGTTSGGLSSKISLLLVRGFHKLSFQDFSPARISLQAEQIEFYVRKACHITEYTILTFTLLFPLRPLLRKIPVVGSISALVCIAAASLDEFHQTFIAGRTGCPRDVGIDSIGIFLAVILYFLWKRKSIYY